MIEQVKNPLPSEIKSKDSLPSLSPLQKAAVQYIDTMIQTEEMVGFDLYSHIDFIAGACCILEEASRLAGDSDIVSLQALKEYVEGKK